jgi:hypothetical protein
MIGCVAGCRCYVSACWGRGQGGGPGEERRRKKVAVGHSPTCWRRCMSRHQLAQMTDRSHIC